MTSTGTQDLQYMLEMVKSRTGYPVSVLPDPSITTPSAMLSASSVRTAHIIRVNPKYDRHSNSLVAQQAAMLLIKWADPDRVPDFQPNSAQLEALKVRLLPQLRQKGVDNAVAGKYLGMILDGLLQQLNSMPCQIMAIEMVYEQCPNLREEILLSVNAEMRELSAVLDPKLKGSTPSEVYGRSVAMNAAYAKKWFALSGDRLALLPYESTGFLKKAAELCGALDQIPPQARDRYQCAVDSWARVLDMEGWYEFIFRKAR